MIIDYLIDDKQSNKNKNNRGGGGGGPRWLAMQLGSVIFYFYIWRGGREQELLCQTSQELRMLSSVTINCQAIKIAMN